MQGTINRIITSSATPLFYCEHCPSSKSSLEFENDTIISNMTSDTIARATVWRQITNEMKWFIYDIAEAFGPPGDYHIQPEASNQKFSTTALMSSRCERNKLQLENSYKTIGNVADKFLQPLIEVALAIYDWLLWRNPVHTLLLALVYTYSIARGWITSLILLLLWAQLTLNYMKSVRKIDIGLSFLPRQDVSMPKFNAVGAEVILDVAKIAQRLLNFCANFFEKLHRNYSRNPHLHHYLFISPISSPEETIGYFWMVLPESQCEEYTIR
ncbi:hypothetical protein DICVIV_10936 [Dictyocaulus viviparus]|uniref:Uncharacterized protein n=1 Tax=Dictyocaulus viviparus TaxID=29172 RepID=A0A0D8XEP4_DICVI|nr:hypothetical protein DICVIV_10936 [Dictyocaulus viviparus]